LALTPLHFRFRDLKLINPAPAKITGRGFRSGGVYNILNLAVTKRKPARFSATKAVKANARERVGQPKPARVIDETKPRTPREAKHKPKLEELLREGE
jgi:hypothetical protein